MSNDLLITPASRKLDFKDSSGNVDATIETDASGNLIITNTGGDISIGDTTSDIFIGDGTNNIDIVFEQSGEIRGLTGVTVTLGASDSNIRMATDLNLNSNDITNASAITSSGVITASGGNSGNWNTAHGWGNHASQSYITNSTASLDASKITSGLLGGARIATGTSGDWWSGNAVKVGTDGVMEVGKYIDFHNADAGTSDYTARLTNTGDHLYATGRLYVNSTQRVFADDYHPNADTLTTARTIAGTSFNGSANIAISYNNLTNKPTIPSLSGYATESYVGTQISNLVDSSPAALNTLNELAAALGDDASFSTTVNASIALKAPTASPTFTGTVTTPNLTIGSGNKIKFANNDYIRYDDANGVGRFHFDSDGGTNNASVQAATFVGALSGNATTATTLATARTISLGGDVTGSVSFNGSSNVTLTAAVVNDSHTHAFNNLTGKTSATGEYSTSGFITAGRGNGGVSLTHNDGYGNANVTFNHKSGVPEQNGNSARIEVNTDSTAGDTQIIFGVNSSVTSGVAIQPIDAMIIRQESVDIRGTLRHAGDDNTYLKFDTDRIRLFAGGTAKFDTNNTYLTSFDITTQTDSKYLRSDTADTASGAITFSSDLNIAEYVYHTGDTDTYIRVQDNSWTFRTGGGDRLVIDNTNLTVNANLDLKAESDTGSNSVHLPRGGHLSLYGNGSLDHSISSRNSAISATDDIRISSYGGVYINLDSNSNNTSTADFVIARHNTTPNLLKVDGETGAGKGLHSYPNAAADGVSISSYAQGTVPINQGVVQIRSVGKTGWDIGDELGSIDWYNNDGSGVGPRNLARIVAVNSQGNGSSTTTFNGEIHFYTSAYNAQLNAAPAMRITESNSVIIGDGTDASSHLEIRPADDGNADDLQFYNGSTRMGEIGTLDTSWLRINQETSKNIYTPRYIRADGGFFVDGSSLGINGSGNFVGGTITGASDANVSNWDTAYGWGDHASAGYAPIASPTFTGDLTIPNKIIHAGDTNTYIQFHAADQFRVVTGGVERLEVNNNNTTVANRLLSTYSGTSAHTLQNATTNGTVLTLTSTADNRVLSLQTDHIFSNGTMVFGDNSHITYYRGSTHNFEGGNVGIGEASPVHRVEALGTDAALIAHNSGNSRGGIAALSSQRVAFLSTSPNDDLVFGKASNPVASSGFTEYMRIDNGTGNVGIGTTSPVSKLHVEGKAFIGEGSVYETEFPSSTASLHVHEIVNDASGVDLGNEAHVVISTGVNATGAQGYQGSLWFGTSDHPAGGSGTGSGSQFVWRNAGIASTSGTSDTGTAAGTGNLEFYTNNGGAGGSKKMTIEPGGDVNINSGGVYSTPISYAANADGWGLKLGASNNAGWDHLGIKLRVDSTGSPRMALMSTGSVETISIWGGKVGIGTNAPAQKLDVQGTILVNNEIQFTNDQMRIYRSSDSMKFRTGSSDRLTISSTGDATLAGHLTFGDNHDIINVRHVRLDAGAGNAIKFWDSTSYQITMASQGVSTYGRVAGETTSDYNMYFRMSGGTNRGFVFQDGTANNVAGIDSLGNARFKADVIAYTSSDKRLKDNITRISNPMEKINKLSGNTFEWNDNQDTYEKGMKDVGVIAQEVEEVLPEIVETRDNGYKAVKYEKMVALLIEGMKEQQEQIEKLEKQIQELKEE